VIRTRDVILRSVIGLALISFLITLIRLCFGPISATKTDKKDKKKKEKKNE
jgi:hypothetical protein